MQLDAGAPMPGRLSMELSAVAESASNTCEHFEHHVAVIGAGLAGSEAALVLARLGIAVALYEMRPGRMTPAHRGGLPAELVCSNSFKSLKLPGAHALLKAELGLLGSPLLHAARGCAVAAGSALAVDRERFSRAVLQKLHQAPSVRLVRREVTSPPDSSVSTILATGPLTSDALARWVADEFSVESLSFYDAVAPIVDGSGVNLHTAFFGTRWEDGADDYLNCPFDKEQFTAFRNALLEADTVERRPFEQQRYFEACLPLEVLARRGEKALAFGPLKPVGLRNPHTGARPYAVCQLRRETARGDSFNLVGCQTRMRQSAQEKVFRMIPGLENVDFLRYGSIHRNTYINSPLLLEHDLSFRKRPRLWCAGQLCGNEGYTESIATGHLAALSVWSRLKRRPFERPPATTALGALLNHVVESDPRRFVPGNINFGLLPPPAAGRGRIGKAEKKRLVCERAIEEARQWRARLGEFASRQSKWGELEPCNPKEVI